MHQFHNKCAKINGRVDNNNGGEKEINTLSFHVRCHRHNPSVAVVPGFCEQLTPSTIGQQPINFIVKLRVKMKCSKKKKNKNIASDLISHHLLQLLSFAIAWCMAFMLHKWKINISEDI